MTPVEVSSDKPAGSDGETEYEMIVPPFAVGDTDVISLGQRERVWTVGQVRRDNIVDNDGHTCSIGTARVGCCDRVRSRGCYRSWRSTDRTC